MPLEEQVNLLIWKSLLSFDMLTRDSSNSRLDFGPKKRYVRFHILESNTTKILLELILIYNNASLLTQR